MDPITIKFAGYQGPKSVHTRAAIVFGQALGRELGDRVDFQLTEDILALGHKSGDLKPLVAEGVYDMAYIGTIRFNQAVPELQMFELPFLIDGRDKINAALDGDLGKYVKARMAEETPYRVLGFWDNGFRHVSNRLRPIRTPDDCKGMRIRTQMTPVIGEGISKLGFDPVAMDIKDFMEKIATGAVDAQENPLTNIYNFSIHEHHPHITLTGHLFGVTMLLCNRERFDGWPADVRAAMISAAAEATAAQRKLAATQDADVLARLDPATVAVVHLTNAERAQFQDLVRPMTTVYKDLLGPDLFAHLD